MLKVAPGELSARPNRSTNVDLLSRRRSSCCGTYCESFRPRRQAYHKIFQKEHIGPKQPNQRISRRHRKCKFRIQQLSRRYLAPNECREHCKRLETCWLPSCPFLRRWFRCEEARARLVNRTVTRSLEENSGDSDNNDCYARLV